MSGGMESMCEDEEKEHPSVSINYTLLNKEVPVWEDSTKQVIKDMKERRAFGLQKYGKSLTANTDEDMLRHLYEELLDASVYIRTLLEQRKHNGN